MPAEEARTFLRRLQEKIASSDIEVAHRDVLIRLRSIIEEDLEAESSGSEHCMPFQYAHAAFSKNEEPTLDELLAEPAVRLVMAKSQVDEAEVRRIAMQVRERRAMTKTEGQSACIKPTSPESAPG
jgi:hypothetical protein